MRAGSSATACKDGINHGSTQMNTDKIKTRSDGTNAKKLFLELVWV